MDRDTFTTTIRALRSRLPFQPFIELAGRCHAHDCGRKGPGNEGLPLCTDVHFASLCRSGNFYAQSTRGEHGTRQGCTGR